MESRITNFEYIQNDGQPYSLRKTLSLHAFILNLSQRLPLTKNNETTLIRPYSMCIIEVNSNIEMDLCRGCELVLVSFDRLGKLYENKLCSFLQESTHEDAEPCSHPMSDTMKSFTCSLIDTYLMHFNDEIFSEVKFNELLFILFEGKNLPQLAPHLKSVLSISDPIFRNKVLNCYTPMISVKDMADSCGYTTAKFEELFKREFGVLPKEWLQSQMANLIKSKLSDTDFSIQHISDSIGMSSPQQMTRFCKKAFGKCPSEMRE